MVKGGFGSPVGRSRLLAIGGRTLAAMPRVPPLGTGLSPLLQWVVVPFTAFVWARDGISNPVSQQELPE